MLIKMESLEELIEKKIMEERKKEIETKEKELKELKTNLNILEISLLETRKKKFKEKYEISCDDVFENYCALVISCCYQGGEGYKIWINIPTVYYEKYINWCKPSHYVVHPEKYSQCQPTKKDQEAYKILSGEEMKVTKETHIERWGN
jgi:hypothetical protein